ncbi:nuclear transport factor 2 family protein [Streptomyces sp. NPDC001478]
MKTNGTAPDAPSEGTATPPDRNKDLVARGLAALVETGSSDGLAPLLAEDFVHHRPDGHDSTRTQWLAAVDAALAPLAGMRVEVRHLLADGDHVVVHSHRTLPGGPAVAVVDIWRIEAGLIAEGWETIEPVDRAAAHLRWWEPEPPR